MRKLYYVVVALVLTTLAVSCQNEEREYDVQARCMNYI